MLTSHPCRPTGNATVTTGRHDATTELLGQINALALADSGAPCHHDGLPEQAANPPDGSGSMFDEISLLDELIEGLQATGSDQDTARLAMDWLHEACRQQIELTERIVLALTSAVDAKDPYTCGHSDRVARVAVRLAEELGCDGQTREAVYRAGLLHDVGKVGVDDRVLHKAGRLSAAEYEHIKKHSEIGYHILRGLPKSETVLQIVLHHHEAWDGSGYPHKLDAERIPLGARIMAVADAFDAMSSDRPYRKRMSDEQVDQILRAGAGSQWDPMVIDAFFSCRDEIRRSR